MIVNTYFPRKKLAILALAVPVAMGLPLQATAQDSDLEEVIVTGTRVADRSAADSPVPVDVITGSEFRDNGSTDIQDMLRTSVPSYDVNAQPISDAATIVRPANLRGLSPDNTLVLVNGKRRHRGSVISFLGGGISDGAQGVDISAIPSLALKQVEVLRDGASSQYGSDAIAGVMNFILRDDAEGLEVVTRYGSTFEGDGNNYMVSANLGLPLGDNGFINITGEVRDVEGTVRSVVRSDVLAGIAGGYAPVSDFRTINSYTNEAPQYWGQPDVEDDNKIFFNAAYELNDSTELYAFGNYGERTVTGGFFYRNVVGNGSGGGQRGGVYRGPRVDPLTGMASDADDAVASVLVGDMDGGSSCIDGIPLPGNGVIPDAGFLASVTADANCFSFIETIPSGFVPRFGGDNEDSAIAVGIRGDSNLMGGVSYDLSAQRGSNRTDYFIRNTVNASLGPNTPRDFVPGGQEQTETVYNLNFVKSVDAGFASDLNVAFGAEYREEEFDLFAGDAASYALGPLSSQGFSSSSNGFGGFPNDTSASQDSTAYFVDLEADVTDALTLQVAARYEDFSAFGTTTNYKLAGVYRLSDDVRIRAARSTGFHAPTSGQASITNVTTQNVNGVLVDQGTLPFFSAAGQLAADFIESAGNGRPTLGTEDADNYSIGIAVDVDNWSFTLDYYNIKVEDRIALGANVDFLAALEFADTAGGSYSSVGEALTALDANGTIDRQQFLGLDDLAQFRFFTNGFGTTTKGLDLVGSVDFDAMGGASTVTFAFNYNETSVDSRGSINPISDGRVEALEDQLPNLKGNIAWNHQIGDIRALVRANYYGAWTSTSNGYSVGSTTMLDVQLAYQVTEELELTFGVDNLFDEYPDRNPGAGGVGQLYPEDSPFGFNGGSWYVQGRYNF
ncbi:TonB-dependent receptor [Candidatus Paraluminiphilus aquimaris]|uniref:TonB-dependent receptor n=1 Tax=Candidatus Paraluminiphilus aquimaris TaxID=2518994 RepID=A0ABY6Q526_9GAMM|nr:TonB-dependent receptor [Candidatus Paraluminiphilus aquimaris]